MCKFLCENIFISIRKIPKSRYFLYFQMNIHTYKMTYENCTYKNERAHNIDCTNFIPADETNLFIS